MAGYIVYYISIYIDLFFTILYPVHMAERKMYNTTLDVELLRRLKILAAQLEKRQNGLLEEDLRDLLKKYEKRRIQ